MRSCLAVEDTAAAVAVAAAAVAAAVAVAFAAVAVAAVFLTGRSSRYNTRRTKPAYICFLSVFLFQRRTHVM